MNYILVQTTNVRVLTSPEVPYVIYQILPAARISNKSIADNGHQLKRLKMLNKPPQATTPPQRGCHP